MFSVTLVINVKIGRERGLKQRAVRGMTISGCVWAGAV